MRRVEVEPDRAAPLLEDPPPHPRRRREVVPARPLVVAEQHRAVLDRDLAAVVLRRTTRCPARSGARPPSSASWVFARVGAHERVDEAGRPSSRPRSMTCLRWPITSPDGPGPGGAGSGSSRGRRWPGPSPAIVPAMLARLRRRTGWRRRCATSRRSAGVGPDDARPAGDLDALEAVGRRPVGDVSRAASPGTAPSADRVSSSATSDGAGLTAPSEPRSTSTQRPEARALGDRVADEHLVVAVGERRVRRPLRRAARDDVRVDRPEQRAERVREALDVAARERGRRPPGRAHQRRVAEEQLVGPLAVTQPEVVRRLRVPPGRAGPSRRSPTGASSSGPALICETATEPRAPLANRRRSVADVLGGHRPRDGVRRPLGRERLDRPGRLLASVTNVARSAMTSTIG